MTLRFLVPCLLPVLALFACSDAASEGATDGGDGDARSSAEHLVLPFVASQQGALQREGQEQRRGALVAAQQLNSLGGILGRQIEIEFLDDNSDQAGAAALVPRITELAAPIVLGPTGSPAASSLRAALPAQVFISPSATSPVLDEKTDAGVSAVFFRTAPSDTLLAKGLALLTSGGESNVEGGAQQCSTLAIVNSDDDYGRPIAERVQSLFKLTASSVSKTIPIPGTVQAPDFYEGIAASVLGAEQHCQLIIAPAEIGANYVRAFRKALQNAGKDWSSFQTFGSNALRTDAFLKDSLLDPAVATSANLANDVRMVAADTAPEGPNYSAFRTLFQAQFPNESIGLSANSYDAVMITALALEVAGSGADSTAVSAALLKVSNLGTAYGPAKIVDALAAIRRGEDIDYVGASGSLDFDNQGQVLSDFLVWRVVDGKFVNTSRFARSSVQ